MQQCHAVNQLGVRKDDFRRVGDRQDLVVQHDCRQCHFRLVFAQAERFHQLRQIEAGYFFVQCVEFVTTDYGQRIVCRPPQHLQQKVIFVAGSDDIFDFMIGQFALDAFDRAKDILGQGLMKVDRIALVLVKAFFDPQRADMHVLLVMDDAVL